LASKGLCEIDPTNRNPIYPRALRLCDIVEGQRFAIVSAWRGGEITTRGVFNGKPYESKMEVDTIYLYVNVNLTHHLNEPAKDLCLSIYKRLPLELDGIVASQSTNFPWCSSFAIYDTPEELEMLNQWIAGQDGKDAINQAIAHHNECWSDGGSYREDYGSEEEPTEVEEE